MMILDDHKSGRVTTLDCGKGVQVSWEVDVDNKRAVWLPRSFTVRLDGEAAQQTVSHWYGSLELHGDPNHYYFKA